MKSESPPTGAVVQGVSEGLGGVTLRSDEVGGQMTISNTSVSLGSVDRAWSNDDGIVLCQVLHEGLEAPRQERNVQGSRTMDINRNGDRVRCLNRMAWRKTEVSWTKEEKFVRPWCREQGRKERSLEALCHRRCSCFEAVQAQCIAHAYDASCNDAHASYVEW